jgi:hypothetical protein
MKNTLFIIGFLAMQSLFVQEKIDSVDSLLNNKIIAS